MKQYLDLLQAIKEKGTYKPAAREGMPGTQSLFGYQFRHNLQDGFPLLTTKKMFWKGVVVELLWFLRGDTNIKFLIDNGVNIWNEDAYNYYRKLCKDQKIDIPLNFDDFITIIKNNDKGLNELRFPHIVDDLDLYIPKDYKLGDTGFQYGKVWRKWQGECDVEIIEELKLYHKNYKEIDQIKNLIEGLKKNPESRRHIVTAIDLAHENDLALYWCHAMFQFNCRPLTHYEKYCKLAELNVDVISRDVEQFYKERNLPQYYLDCQLYQRSADVFLGVPFNIASYALLTEIIAKMCNMVPGELITSYGDVHIYDTHKLAVEEQLKRTPTELPKLKLEHSIFEPRDHPKASIISLIENIEIDELLSSLEAYNPQPSIKAELSTGLKK